MESRSAYAKMTVLLLLTVLYRCNPDGLPLPGSPDLSSAENGDLIYRFGDGFFSGLFRDFSEKEKIYSHTGILIREGSSDSLFVIHAEGSELTGVGNVKKEPASVFLHKVDDWAVYRFKGTREQRDKIAGLALDFWRRRMPFDMHFDALDSSAVYCTELVADCINVAAGAPVIIPRTCRDGRYFIAIDDTYMNTSIQIIIKNTKNN